ncbi:LacI family DNA-binding transcriptional regulator [Cellulomonas sp. zg-ZUI222]|uniref:LacI family DNA-binding transcriptional regulator n=1 Tax=Cellulomonas wangleii TaxID=2816956 RepID=A0ABX8D7U3_9CELL|nr:LacI family DNA-binding transcriptional regulator [Cellulomonas wangleii]MBO0921607.1 LacI family DNA-binding transcriptional regulator [Cellulomonas wangleii]MBO0925103.1 LacI family DNA-binding transcriptional regulator [Cellulomonas wangleii]QVI63484.1 LacI family DNA-binding transcriptional regulator [Cellulomonas wangleii]
MGRVTLQTVADVVGVSRMTVSNAFSRPDQLSATLRERILAAAAELGYAGPDPTARALARRSTGAVGAVMTDSLGEAFRDPAAAAFFGALAEELAPTGLSVSLIPAAGVGGHLHARDLPIDAAVVYACAGDTEAVGWLARRRLPLVFVDQEPLAGSTGIVLDDVGGGRAAVEHLVGLGHRDIAVLTMNSGLTAPAWRADPSADNPTQVARKRTAGALAALADAGLTGRVLEVPDNRATDTAAGVELLLADPQRPTGVVCFSDLMGATLVRAAQQAGLTVPRDLSVVGFDDSFLAQTVRPALTTLRQDFDAKGRLAAQALIDALAHARGDGPEPAPTTVVVPVELVVRGSTGPAPA